jgi:hypothetical protein
MKTTIRVIFCGLLLAAKSQAQTVYSLTPNTKGNQIELSIANQSARQAAHRVRVTLAKKPIVMTFASSEQTLDAIAPNAEAAATFTFDVGKPSAANRKDTLEFHINDGTGSSWTKQIVVNYAAPEVFKLEQNYPNPFNPTTTIEYQLPVESCVSLEVYDLLGREVATLVNEVQGLGFKSVEFSASNLASGVYFYRMEVLPVNGGAAFSQLRRLVLVK